MGIFSKESFILLSKLKQYTPSFRKKSIKDFYVVGPYNPTF